MTGDFHDANRDSLARLNRMMRGDFSGESVSERIGDSMSAATAEAPPRKRKKAGENLQLAGMEDDTPEELVELGREYKRCQTAESKAKEKTKAKMAEIIDKMHELNVERVRLEVDGNMKWLTINETEKLKWEKSETAPPDEE